MCRSRQASHCRQFAFFLAFGLAPGAAWGETPTDDTGGRGAPVVDLHTRMDSLESQVVGLSKHLTVSTAGEDVQLILGGNVVANMYYNQVRPVASGTPFFLFPDSELNQQTFDANARESNLFAYAIGPKLGDQWETDAMILVYFYNTSTTADTYGLLPLLAYGEIRNPSWRFSAGLQHDVFGPLDPNMLAFSYLFASGNAGSFRMNTSGTGSVGSDGAQLDVTLGVSEPTTTTVTAATLVEDNGWPNVEGRVALSIGTAGADGATRPFEIGVSGVVGQVRQTSALGERDVADVWGVNADLRLGSTRVGLKGEAYVGQALGAYNGGVFQTFGPEGQAVGCVGGWGEAYLYIVPERLHAHGGYGLDSPNSDDLGPASITRNDTIFANLVFEATRRLSFGGEFTWRTTDYDTLDDNQGFGVQTQMKFGF